MNHEHYLQSWLKKYYRRTNRLLKCPQKTRLRLIEELQNSVEEFLEEHPNAAPSDIVQHLGTPEQIAHDYLSSLDERQLHDYVSRTKTIRRVLAAMAIVVMILAAIFVLLYRNWKDNIYYYSNYNIYEGTTEVEDEE